MEKQITITYRWWNNGNESSAIAEEHYSQLETAAMERIQEMMNQGYGSGELLCDLDDENYKGWFEIKFETIA